MKSNLEAEIDARQQEIHQMRSRFSIKFPPLLFLNNRSLLKISQEKIETLAEQLEVHIFSFFV